MPIKGLTDRGMAFPEIGRIRKGAPKGKDRPGKDLDYFRVEFDGREADAQKNFKAAYGDTPQELIIWLPYAEIERCWDVWLEAYTAGQMVARADGEIFLFLRDIESGEVLVQNGIDLSTGKPRPYVEGEPVGHYVSKKGTRVPVCCQPVGRLKVIVPALERFACLTLHTTSYHDIVNISSELEALQFINGGSLQNIDIVLKRKPVKISVPKEDGSRMRVTKWLISLEAAPIWVQEQINGRKRRASLRLPEPAAILPDDEDDDDIIEGEHREATPVVDSPKIRWASRQLGLLVVENIVPDVEMAESILNRSILPDDVDDDLLVRWARKFMGHESQGYASDIAAREANQGYLNAMKEIEK